MTAIPYQGSADAVVGLVRGDVAFGADTLAATQSLICGGKQRALAVVQAKRAQLLPEVPSYLDLKLDKAVLEGWYALAGPSGLPDAVSQSLQKTLRQVVSEPAIPQRLGQLALEATWLPAARLGEQMDREVVRSRAIVARTKMVLE